MCAERGEPCLQALSEYTDSSCLSFFFSTSLALKSVYNILSCSMDIVIITDSVRSYHDLVVRIYLCQ